MTARVCNGDMTCAVSRFCRLLLTFDCGCDDDDDDADDDDDDDDVCCICCCDVGCCERGSSVEHGEVGGEAAAFEFSCTVESLANSGG